MRIMLCGIAVREYRVVGMVVHIDEARRHHEAFGVDGAARGPARKLAQRRDPSALDADVAVKCGIPGAVGDPSVANKDVELLRCRQGHGQRRENE